MACSINVLQLKISTVNNILIYNNHTMNQPKEHPPPLILSHPVVNLVFFVKVMANMNTICIVYIIIIDVHYSKKITDINIISIKHWTHICGPKIATQHMETAYSGFVSLKYQAERFFIIPMPPNTDSLKHIWELPVYHYHKNSNLPLPFLGSNYPIVIMHDIY